jgi:hypothetical protein
MPQYALPLLMAILPSYYRISESGKRTCMNVEEWVIVSKLLTYSDCGGNITISILSAIGCRFIGNQLPAQTNHMTGYNNLDWN